MSLVLISTFSSGIAGCNTTKGLDEELEATGEAIEEEVEEHSW